MRKFLWIVLAALFVAIGAPGAKADAYTYTFIGTGYFAGTDVSFTIHGPAVFGDLYAPNPGATDLFVTGINEGSIYDMKWELSPYVFSPCTSVCTVQMYLLATRDVLDGPTFAGTTIPGPGVYGEYFGHGTLTITAATPEPTSFVLMLSGLGLLGLILAIRKRTPVVQSPAS